MRLQVPGRRGAWALHCEVAKHHLIQCYIYMYIINNNNNADNNKKKKQKKK